MSVTIRQAGNEWLIEVQREPVAAACTEAEGHELAEQWTAKLKWRASCRFAPPWLDEEEYNRIFSAHSLHPTPNHHRAGFSDDEMAQGLSPEALHSARLRSEDGRDALEAAAFDFSTSFDQLARGHAVTALTSHAKGGSAALTMLGTGLTPEQAKRFAEWQQPRQGQSFGTAYEKYMFAKADSKMKGHLRELG